MKGEFTNPKMTDYEGGECYATKKMAISMKRALYKRN
jgi:hypothetical protein